MDSSNNNLSVNQALWPGWWIAGRPPPPRSAEVKLKVTGVRAWGGVGGAPGDTHGSAA